MFCTSNCACWGCTTPNWLAPSRRRSSSRCSRLPCVSNSTRIGCCCTCPAPARSRRCWQRSVGDSARVKGWLTCWLLHDLARLGHETAPPTLHNNPFTFYPASGGRGSIAKIIKKIASPRRKCTAVSLCKIQAGTPLHVLQELDTMTTTPVLKFSPLCDNL
jgi:hypothetical protein